MSEYRRKLLAQKKETGSWYRICEGGIYTATNAYIDTGYKEFTNRNLEVYTDCKILSAGTYNVVRALWGSSGPSQLHNPYDWAYNYAGAVVGSSWYNDDTYYMSRWKNKSDAPNVGELRPYLNKKVRLTVTPNNGGEKSYIQVYNGSTLGEKVYASSETVERQNYYTQYPILIFARSSGSNAPNSIANNIAIYETRATQSGVPVYFYKACQLTHNITGDLAWDNQAHQAGEYGMYDEVSGKFFGNANSTGYFLENIDEEPEYTKHIVLNAQLAYNGDTQDLISGNNVQIGTGTMVWDSNKNMYKFSVSDGQTFSYAAKWEFADEYKVQMAYSDGYTVIVDIEQEQQNTNDWQAWCSVPDLREAYYKGNTTDTRKPYIYIAPYRYSYIQYQHIPLHRYAVVMDRINKVASFYQDGDLITTIVWNQTQENAPSVASGVLAQLQTNMRSFSMWAKNFKIYNYVMSADDILSEYQQNNN